MYISVNLSVYRSFYLSIHPSILLSISSLAKSRLQYTICCTKLYTGRIGQQTAERELSMSPVPGTVPCLCPTVPCHVPAQLLLVNCPTTSGMHWLRAQAGWQAAGRLRSGVEQQGERTTTTTTDDSVWRRRSVQQATKMTTTTTTTSTTKIEVTSFIEQSEHDLTRPTVGEKPRRHIDMERLPPDWRRQWRLLCSHSVLDS